MNPVQLPVPIQTIPGSVTTDMITYKSSLDHFTQLTIAMNQSSNLAKYLKFLHAVHETYFPIMKKNPQLLDQNELKFVNSAYAEMYQVVENDETAFNFLDGPLPKYSLHSASKKVAQLAIMPSAGLANEDSAAVVEEEDTAPGPTLSPTIISNKRARKEEKPVEAVVQKKKSRTERTSPVVKIQNVGNIIAGQTEYVAATSGINKAQLLSVIIPLLKPKENVSVKPELLDGTVAEVIEDHPMNALVHNSNQRFTRSSTGNSKNPSATSRSSFSLNTGISQQGFFVCHCGRSYIRPKAFNAHQALHVMNYRCTNGDCKIETHKKDDLVRHILVKHFNMPKRYNKKQEREWREKNPTVKTRIFIEPIKNN